MLDKRNELTICCRIAKQKRQVSWEERVARAPSYLDVALKGSRAEFVASVLRKLNSLMQGDGADNAKKAKQNQATESSA